MNAPLNCARDLPEALNFLRRMVEINSFTANAAGVNAVGGLVAEAFAPLGFRESRVPAARREFGDHWFLATESRGERPTVAFVSHLDTVFSEEEERRNKFVWREEGTRIHGPGTNDIKGGTALAWLMLTAMRREMPELFKSVNWMLALNAREEVDSADFGAACRRIFPGNTAACLVLEADSGSNGDFCVVGQRKGRATFEVKVEGRGAHAGSQHARGANAIVELARVVGEISALTDYAAGVTVNVGSIRGGTVNNRIPHEAVASLEMRAWSPQAFESARAAILAFSGEGVVRSADGYPCGIAVSQLDETPPWPENPETRRLVELWAASGRQLGLPMRWESRGGLSDGNVLWEHFPTLDGLGPCGDFSHCSERSADGSKEQEWVDTASFVPKAQLNAAAIALLLENER
jgi:glutamate carboxypeptidase